MRHLSSLLLMLAACGGTPSGGDDDDEAPARADAPSTGSPDGAQAAADAAPVVTADVLPMCQPYTRTVQYADGRREVSTARYAIVNAVSLGDDFTLEHCGYTTVPPSPPPSCPTGATCTGTAAPSGLACSQTKGTYNFLDGKLLVWCGTSYEQYAANGSLTSSSSTSYQSIRVTY